MASSRIAVTQTTDSKGAEFEKRLGRDIAIATNGRSGISFAEGVKKALSALTETTEAEKPAKDEKTQSVAGG